MEGQMNIFDLIGNNDLHRPEKVHAKIGKKRIKMIEFFAGYGSQSLAWKRLGIEFDHHLVCEFDKYACKTYSAIHGIDVKPSDIRDLHGADLHIDDTESNMYMASYSFPCTDLSLAGSMRGMSKADWEAGESTRSGLLWEVERILKECVRDGLKTPQILLMENVPQVVSGKNRKEFDDWCAFLESIGYVNHWKILNAADYGIPQSRKRCFMWSFLKSEFGEGVTYEFPKPIPLTKCMKDFLEDKVDEKYYINSDRAKKLIEELILNGTLEMELARLDRRNE